MKKIKVLALCAVLVGLGGAMSAKPSSKYDKYKDMFLAKMEESLPPGISAEDIWNGMSDADVEAILEEVGLGSGSGNSSNNDKDDDDNPSGGSWGLPDEVFEELEAYKGKMTRDQFINEAVSRGFAKSKSDAEALADALEEHFGKDFWKGGDSSSGEDSPSFDISGIGLMSLEDLKNAHPYTPLAVPTSQSGLVSEVGDYMDVNSWQSVQFDKLFTHVGYNINNQFNAGLATRLGKVYIGGFFYGNFIDSTTTTNKAPKYKQTTSKTNVSGLIGIGNLGIKPSILFSPKSGNSTTKTTNDGKSTTETTNSYEIYPQVDVGLNVSLGNLALTPHAHLGFDFYPNKTTRKDTTTSYGGTSNTWTMLGFGTGLELPKKDGSIITHSFSADLDFAFRSKTKGFMGDKTVTGEDGLTYGAFTLGWTGAIALADNLSVKLNSALPISWVVVKTSKDSNSSGTVIAPAFAASLKYQATPKLALGLSADLGLPEIDIGGAKIDNDTKSTDVRFNTEKGFALEVGAGFRFDFTQNVTLDCGWNFGGNLFNNYFKDVSDHSSAFWDGLSYIFSDIQLGLSVKL